MRRALTVVLAVAAGAAWAGAPGSAPAQAAPAATSAPVAPLVLRPAGGLAAQYGYRPVYARNVPAFDSLDRPYLRSRSASEEDTAFVHTLVGSAWVKRGFTGALEALYPDFAGTVGGGGRLNDRLIFDGADVAYSVVTVRLDSGETRNVLLWSRDLGVTWRAAELPGGLIVPEHWVGHNQIAGPPFLLIQTPAPPLPGTTTRRYRLWATQPRLEGETLVVPAPLLVTERSLRLVTAAGGASPAVTWQGKTHLVWAGVTTGSGPGSPTFAATFDPAGLTLSAKVRVAYGWPRNNVHCTPGICVDANGYLHVVTGARMAPFHSVTSLVPGDVSGGWSAPVDVLSSGRQTYVSLVCGPGGTLHLVYRQHRRDVDGRFGGDSYSALVYQKKAPGRPWGAPRLLVVPPYAGYAIYHQKLAVDHHGHLWVSCSYCGGPARERWQDAVREWQLAGGRGSKPGPYLRRMVLVSTDAGRRWRLATTADFVAGVRAEAAATAGAGLRPTISTTPPVPSIAWRWQNPLPQGEFLAAVDGAGGALWTVGGGRAVGRSTDGGQTWAFTSGRYGSGLRSVVAVAADRAWAVGGRNAVVLLRATSDGGIASSGFTLGSNASQALNDIAAAGATTLWIVGTDGQIWNTTDGGAHWRKQPSRTDGTLNGVAFVGRRRGCAVGNDGRVLRTTDGGRTWNGRSSGTDADLLRVRFVDSSVGWAVGGEGTALRTSDGGLSWRTLVTGTGEDLCDATFLDRSRGWVVGVRGTVMQTTDGGDTWMTVDGATSSRLNGVTVTTGDRCVAVGAQGAIVVGAFGDAALARISSGSTAGLRDVAALTTGTALAVGAGGAVLRSSDAGAHWNEVATGSGAALDALAFADGQTGLAAGARGTILRTSDAGLAWTSVGPGGPHLRAAAWSDPVTAWVVGDAGTALRSSDAGVTWQPTAVSGAADLQAICFSGSQSGWIVGGDPSWNDRATILRTTDGGLSWQRVSTGVRGALTAVRFVSPLRGWAAGVHWGSDLDTPSGVILSTLDGGRTWVTTARVKGRRFVGLWALSRRNVWAVGEGGLAMHSLYGGPGVKHWLVWQWVRGPASRELEAVAFADATHGWIVGEGGTIVAGRSDWAP